MSLPRISRVCQNLSTHRVGMLGGFVLISALGLATLVPPVYAAIHNSSPTGQSSLTSPSSSHSEGGTAGTSRTKRMHGTKGPHCSKGSNNGSGKGSTGGNSSGNNNGNTGGNIGGTTGGNSGGNTGDTTGGNTGDTTGGSTDGSSITSTDSGNGAPVTATVPSMPFTGSDPGPNAASAQLP
jgi:hypothetical protein